MQVGTLLDIFQVGAEMYGRGGEADSNPVNPVIQSKNLPLIRI
jgi:hypothetical protein